jgi:putative ABC transport system ATP-binding protein
MTVIIVTHNSAISQMADRIIRFKNGKVASIQKNENPKPVSEIKW